MRMPSLLGPSLLVAAVISTSALPPAEHLRIVPAGEGKTSAPTLPADRLSMLAEGSKPASTVIAGRQAQMGSLWACGNPLAGPALRLLAGGERGFCRLRPATR